MENTDVVYILRNGIAENVDELAYSLRTVCKNWTYRRVWFVGGDPRTIKPDGAIYHTQRGASRYEKVRDSVARVCECGDISDPFYLFNDDFFIMRPFTEYQPRRHGTIWEHVERLQNRWHGSNYTKEIEYTAQLLKQYGYTQYNYALHVPFLVNKKKALEVYRAFPSSSMFKDLYGNYCNIGGVEAEDGKVTAILEQPKGDIISTTEATFAHGFVGQVIRQRFNKKSKYEGV